MHRAPLSLDTSAFSTSPLTTHQLLFQETPPIPFSRLQKPLPFAQNPLPQPLGTAPLSRPGFSGCLAPPSLICTNFPRSLVLSRHPCRLPFPLCVPIPGQAALPGSDDFPRPPVYPLDHLLGSLRPRRTGGCQEGRQLLQGHLGPGGEQPREWTRSSLSPPGGIGGGAGLVDLSCVGDFLLSAVAVVGCALSAVGFLFCFVYAFGGGGKRECSE